MVISLDTIDKLGVKLYDKVSAVVAELIANSYDADATDVQIELPIGKLLASKDGSQCGYYITVSDNGNGMTPQEVNDFYLVVGKERRKDPKRGPTSPNYGRHVIGRKGIGKLAPFGICKTIEVITSGGSKTEKGYLTAHLIIDYNGIKNHIETNSSEPYKPKTGEFDGSYQPQHGTKIILKNFFPRKIPDIITFHRQLARSFGIEAPNWKVTVQNSMNKTENFTVGRLDIEILEGTRIVVDNKSLILEDGTVLPVSGWIAISKHPYRDEEMAGIRIYARGKIVAQTRDFGIKSGFTGEHTLRSYLVGVLCAEWVDEDNDEDLIGTDRQDIIWSSEKGEAFKKWGQSLIKELGKNSTMARNDDIWNLFLERSKIKEDVKKRYNSSDIQGQALKIARFLGTNISKESLDDPSFVKNLRELAISIAPHTTLIEKLREASNPDNPFEAVVTLFSEARIAELASLGQIALERLNAIDVLKKNIKERTEEKNLQEILERAPFIVDPESTLLSSNKSIETLREMFEDWYEKKYNQKIYTSSIKHPNKRPDFILLSSLGYVSIIEIKSSGHSLKDDEFERLQNYIDALEKFLEDNNEFLNIFRAGVKTTLICDSLDLSRTSMIAFKKYQQDGKIKKYTWREVILTTENVHRDFIEGSKSTPFEFYK